MNSLSTIRLWLLTATSSPGTWKSWWVTPWDRSAGNKQQKSKDPTGTQAIHDLKMLTLMENSMMLTVFCSWKWTCACIVTKSFSRTIKRFVCEILCLKSVIYLPMSDLEILHTYSIAILDLTVIHCCSLMWVNHSDQHMKDQLWVTKICKLGFVLWQSKKEEKGEKWSLIAEGEWVAKWGSSPNIPKVESCTTVLNMVMVINNPWHTDHLPNLESPSQTGKQMWILFHFKSHSN